MEIKRAASSLPPEDQITDQLERMLASPNFNATAHQRTLLKYVVSRALEGQADSINAYTVATKAFGRRSDFDQNIDPIVSIQANRLRVALARYYETAGKNDPIRIDIPKGAYVPIFEKMPHTRSVAPITDREQADIKAEITWPSVLIRPLSNLSDDPDLKFWGIGLATELAHELNRYPDIRVLIHGSGNPNTSPDQHSTRFVIDGSVRSDETSIKIILTLKDTRTGHQIWSESKRSSIETAQLIAFQEDLSRTIAVKIAGERGLIVKTLDEESKRRLPQHSTVYESVLRYFEYDTTHSSEAFSRALAALEKAVVIDPEYGPAWTMLARLYAEIYALDIPGFEGPLEKAFKYAQNGKRLSPNDQRCRAVMAYIHLFRNDLAAGVEEAIESLRLGPKTLFFLDGIGYVLTLLGDWERGPALIENVIHLNPFYGNFVHFALWVNYLRQNDYINAHRETMKLNESDRFWDHIARASSYGLIGNIEDGRNAAAQLLKLKPDFSERGRILIEHYIKFNDIVERVIEGLDAVGLEVK